MDDAPSLTTLDFASDALGGRREVRIFVPPGGELPPGWRFPVLYLNDGQNMFDEARAAGGVAWEIQKTSCQLAAAGRIPPLILVGIDHGGDARRAEYAPFDGTFEGQPVVARGMQYERFLVDELKPCIDRHFMTSTRPEDTGLLGASMGGLITLAIGLRRPDVFGRIGAMSPTCDGHGAWLVDELERRREALGRLRLWFDTGARDGPATADAAQVVTRIGTLLGGAQENFAFRFDANGEAHASSWGRRAADALDFLFGGMVGELC